MKKLRMVLAVAACLFGVLTFAVVGCGDGEGDEELLGVWTDASGVMELEFQADGTLLMRAMGQEEQGTYTANDGKLYSPDPETGEMGEVEYTIEGDHLILGPDGQEGVLMRKNSSGSSGSDAA